MEVDDQGRWAVERQGGRHIEQGVALLTEV
jgi:hypothetical protein